MVLLLCLRTNVGKVEFTCFTVHYLSSHVQPIVLPATSWHFCTKGTWEESSFLSELKPQKMPRTTWIKMMPAVTCGRERESTIDTFRRSALEMQSSFFQTEITSVGFAVVIRGLGHWREGLRGKEMLFWSKLEGCSLSVMWNWPWFSLSDIMEKRVDYKRKSAVECKGK